MKRFIEGEHRGQGTLLPGLLDDDVSEDNPVRDVDVFVEELNLAGLGFKGVQPAKTGQPAYHPAVLLNSTSTVISTGFSRADGLSAKPNVTWN